MEGGKEKGRKEYSYASLYYPQDLACNTSSTILMHFNESRGMILSAPM